MRDVRATDIVSSRSHRPAAVIRAKWEETLKLWLGRPGVLYTEEIAETVGRMPHAAD